MNKIRAECDLGIAALVEAYEAAHPRATHRGVCYWCALAARSRRIQREVVAVQRGYYSGSPIHLMARGEGIMESSLCGQVRGRGASRGWKTHNSEQRRALLSSRQERGGKERTMSQFDVAVVQADRLLGRSWREARREASRLAGMGLAVEVDEGLILLRGPRDGRTEDVRIGVLGAVWSVPMIQWQDGHWEQNGEVSEAHSSEEAREMVSRALQEQVAGMGRAAARLQAVTEGMARTEKEESNV